MLNNLKKLNNNLNFKIFLSTLKILQIWIRIWAWFSWLHLLHVYMYVSIKDNSSAMNSYLEYMHGPTGIENRWIITIDTLYCCVLLHAVPGTLHRVPAIIHALTHGTVRSPTHVREVWQWSWHHVFMTSCDVDQSELG